MHPSLPTTPVSPPHAQLRRFLLHSPAGRALLGAVLLAILCGGRVWYTRYRGTGWISTLSFDFWTRHTRGDDLYHARDAMLVHGNRDLPEVALTFDDGPHPLSRPRILDILKRYGVHGTFFDVGVNMERSPALLRRTVAEGHEVANHSDHHYYLPQLSAEQRRREINDPDITFFAITNRHLNLLRPPGMRYNPAVLAEARGLGYVVVGYTSAANDADAADPTPADTIAERTLSRVENGSILLLHDYPATADALPAILDALRNRGYRCVTVAQMLDHLPEPVRSEARSQLATP